VYAHPLHGSVDPPPQTAHVESAIFSRSTFVTADRRTERTRNSTTNKRPLQIDASPDAECALDAKQHLSAHQVFIRSRACVEYRTLPVSVVTGYCAQHFTGPRWLVVISRQCNGRYWTLITQTQVRRPNLETTQPWCSLSIGRDKIPKDVSMFSMVSSSTVPSLAISSPEIQDGSRKPEVVSFWLVWLYLHDIWVDYYVYLVGLNATIVIQTRIHLDVTFPDGSWKAPQPYWI